MNFDIDKLGEQALKTFDVEIGKQEDGTSVGFRIAGPNSTQFIQAMRSFELLRTKKRATVKGLLDESTDEGAAFTVELNAQQKELIVQNCVVDMFGWRKDGKPAEFNRVNLLEILNHRPYLYTTLFYSIIDEANFATG